MMTMKQEIPEEVITDILWRLPISHCIVRFQCVCKSWRALLSDPSFTLRDDESADSDLQIMLNFRSNNGGSVYSLYSADTLEPLLPSPVPLPSNHWDLKVAGCCNGLICISDGRRDLMLWNPATSETKLLPPSPSRVSYCSDLRAVGFGFDSETDDYKIVRQLEYDDGSWRCQYVEVYSLRNNSWTKLYAAGDDDDDSNNDNGYKPWLPSRQIPQCNKGKLYWSYWDIASRKSLRFDSFDLNSQEFQNVDLRCPFENVGNTPECLLKEDSMVALFTLYDADDVKGYSKYWEIWVLLKYWVSESWTKLVVVPSCFSGANILSSFGISRNLKCLFWGVPSSKWRKGDYSSFYDDMFFVGFQPETGKFSNSDLQIKGPSSAYIIDYMPSQVCIRDYYMSS